jgi:chloramphenicol 3-O-phosphotransferase
LGHLAKEGLHGAVTSWAPPIVHVRGNGNYIVQGKRVNDRKARMQIAIPVNEDCVEVSKDALRALLEEDDLGADDQGEQRDKLLDSFERDAFHLELKDVYRAAYEDGPMARW